MISEKELINLIKDKSLNSSVKDNLQAVIDDELAKSAEDMDTELIEYCLDLLLKIENRGGNASEELKAEQEKNCANGSEKEDGRKIIPFSRKNFRFIRLFAAVFLIFTVMSVIFVQANEPEKNRIPKGFVSVDDYGMKIVFSDNTGKGTARRKGETEFEKQLAKYGFTEVLFPDALLTDDFEYSINDLCIQQQYSDRFDFVFDFECKSLNLKGSVTLTKFNAEKVSEPSEVLDIDDFRQISANGLDIYAFRHQKYCSLRYREGNIIYCISLDGIDFEYAKDIAETVR